MNATFTPWTRYGHDRLYVAVDERRIGCRDEAIGDDRPEDRGDAALLIALIALIAVVDAHLAGTAWPSL